MLKNKEYIDGFHNCLGKTAELKDCEADSVEQARLLGMSGEREAAHLSRIERLERQLAKVSMQRELLLVACHAVEKDLADHPACLAASSTQEDLDAAGGDAAFLTWNMQILLAAIKKAGGEL
jgi:hypothetical protein